MTTAFTALEELWESSGGSAQSAPMAAGIALAESGGNPDATDASDPYGGSFGLWQINGAHAPGGLASASWISQIENPSANAAEAVSLSDDGTNWQPWEDDRLWEQWVAAGSPADPSAATVEGWLSAAGANTGAGAPTATLTSFLGGLGNFAKGLAEGAGGLLGLLGPGDTTATQGAGQLASAAGSAVASPIEHFIAKALLVLAGLGLGVYGVIKLVDPGAHPATMVDDVAKVAPLAAA